MDIDKFLNCRCLALWARRIMAPLRYTAKFDPFLSLDCAPTPSTLAQSKERKGSNFAIWQHRSATASRGSTARCSRSSWHATSTWASSSVSGWTGLRFNRRLRFRSNFHLSFQSEKLSKITQKIFTKLVDQTFLLFKFELKWKLDWKRKCL